MKQERRPGRWPTHCLWSGSFSLILSSTFISSLAASLYFSKFLMIFSATAAPPLGERRRFRSVFMLSISNLEAHLWWSKHFTTFPNVPSPNVSRISSEKQMELELEPSRGSSPERLNRTYIAPRGRRRSCTSAGRWRSPSPHLQPGRTKTKQVQKKKRENGPFLRCRQNAFILKGQLRDGEGLQACLDELRIYFHPSY